ncbi:MULTISPECIES: DsrE family protein [Kordiimonas]|jgi:intracellular sulfur oxidation DsrE/DsrF family protein|uniref:DsrE family protein n=1 Tax=Kordiimonas TaxID=288021 RepID=UPI00257E0CAA|nr:DsrE family protein [Kordiimonas sp. UBA4487]
MKQGLVGAALLCTGMLCAMPVIADDAEFTKGPLITEYGPVVAVPGATMLSADSHFKVAFDVVDKGEEGKVSRRLESAARFLNMHVAAGADPKNIKLAVVIHGKAVFDVTNDAKHGGPNANADLIQTLMAHGVTFHVCGQSAAYQGVKKEDLLPGVEMALSAMTAHALLQQQGYTLNP